MLLNVNPFTLNAFPMGEQPVDAEHRGEQGRDTTKKESTT